MLSRRSILGLSAGLLASGFSAYPALAQNALASKLLEPGPLPEKIFGSPTAPVTVIEYASLTCSHCKNFHITTWPSFKAKYVDTGKVRFIAREFPLDPLSTAGFMLARCADEPKWYPIVDLLFKTQEGWAHSPKPLDALTQTMKQAGFTQETVEACLRREDLFQGVKQIQERGSKEFGVSSTPTFFVNGEKRVGALSIDEFDKILAPLLSTSSK